MSELIDGLGPNGKLMVVGAAAEPIEVTPMQLISGGRMIQGWSYSPLGNTRAQPVWEFQAPRSRHLLRDSEFAPLSSALPQSLLSHYLPLATYVQCRPTAIHSFNTNLQASSRFADSPD